MDVLPAGCYIVMCLNVLVQASYIAPVTFKYLTGVKQSGS
jgi:hypothetical protein